MPDISFANYFGGQNDFEILKKWLRVNAEVYKDVLQIAKERCELEQEYSGKLSKLSTRLLKVLQMPKGSVNLLWTNTAQNMNQEAEIHKRLASQLQDGFYKPLAISNDQFIKYKKPVEMEIEKCLKNMQDKREEEMKNKKKAFAAMKECEKAFESIEEYKKTHPTAQLATDKEKTKSLPSGLDGLAKCWRSQIEKRAHQLKDASTRSEKEYFNSSLAAEESRHTWEQSYLIGLEQLQKIETDRLTSMKAIIESYHKSISEIPNAFKEICSKIQTDIQKTNINDDLIENAMHYMSKSPNIFKTEQILLTLYSEFKENPMNLSRRIENIQKRISALYQVQQTWDKLRTGALKMLTVYEDTPQFTDDITKKKAKREYSKAQSLVNLLSANIYKLLVSLNNWQKKPAPPDPLLALGLRIVNVADRTSILCSTLESKTGAVVMPYEPGIMSRSNSIKSNSTLCKFNSLDDEDDFDDDPDCENVSPIKRGNQQRSIKRPLPTTPNSKKCRAEHDFIARDEMELSFNQGDIITIVKTINDIWWEGELNGKVGLIPKDYVFCL